MRARVASIVLVHGGWHGAWCWEDNFVPRLGALGNRVVAKDLPHHGAQDRRGLRFASIADYVDAVARVAEGLDRPIVLVGHSMGGFVVQKYLERQRADFAILLGSVPPSGSFGSDLRLARSHPMPTLKSSLTGHPRFLIDTLRLVREILFRPETPDGIVERCFSRLQDESLRANLDMMFMDLPKPRSVSTPIAVVGGQYDAAISVDEIQSTARAYGTKPTIFPIGHDAMLDTGWEDVADHIHELIKTEVG